MRSKLLILILFIASNAFGQPTGMHSYAIDLTEVVDDRVKVTVDAKLIQWSNSEQNIYNFHFPATIPGTYATLDYGRFIQNFQAYDAYGTKLKVKTRETLLGFTANRKVLNTGLMIPSMHEYARTKFLNLPVLTIKSVQIFS